jgi:hypothetical protein
MGTFLSMPGRRYNMRKRGMMRTVVTSVDDGTPTITITTSVGFPKRTWNRTWNIIITTTTDSYIPYSSGSSIHTLTLAPEPI